MKTMVLSIFLALALQAPAQEKFFQFYTDSADLVNEANKIVKEFVAKVNATAPVFASNPTAILNTKPYLIFYSPKENLISLPIWHQVIPPQQAFFSTLAGGEDEGKKMFALFFNGFYLAHELGHAFGAASKRNSTGPYQSEYFANQIAMQYWRQVGRTDELNKCYAYAKKIVAQLPDPVPAGVDRISYFNEHYHELAPDPYKYGFFQMRQFVEIYEDESQPTFEQLIRDTITQVAQSKD